MFFNTIDLCLDVNHHSCEKNKPIRPVLVDLTAGWQADKVQVVLNPL